MIKIKNEENIKTMPLEVLFARWMMSSYLYYCVPDVQSPWSDAQFDYASNRLLKNWLSLDHPHKKLVSIDNMTAGTGFDIEFPLMVREAAYSWLEVYKGEI